MVVRSKFETDQKNREDKIARKRAVEEAERVEAAKNCKLMADNSSKLVQGLEASLVCDETVANEIIMLLHQKIDSKLGKLGEMDGRA